MLTDAQPVSEQPHTTPYSSIGIFSFFFFFNTMSYGMEYPLGQFRSAILILTPSTFLYSPAPLLAGQYETLKS